MFSHTGYDLCFWCIGVHARTCRGHGAPVTHVHEDTADEGPLPTHVRLHRMNGAHPVPEDAVTALSLGQQTPPAGYARVIR